MPAPIAVATAICATAPGSAIARTRHQVADREVQADAEHQQDHADLGELAGEVGVGDEARRERADRDAGQQVADQRRQAQASREKPEAEREDEADRDQCNELGVMGHVS